jgi:hypothetical protein
MKTAVLLIFSVLLLAGCSRSKEVVPACPALLVSGSPSAVYDRVLPAITARLRSGTKVVRTDDPGVVLMRFSVFANNRSVRLVDVVLKKNGISSTEVVIHAKKFSFILTAARDEVDLSVERTILELFKDEPNRVAGSN